MAKCISCDKSGAFKLNTHKKYIAKFDFRYCRKILGLDPDFLWNVVNTKVVYKCLGDEIGKTRGISIYLL